jgi:hypothetical protein
VNDFLHIGDTVLGQINFAHNFLVKYLRFKTFA